MASALRASVESSKIANPDILPQELAASPIAALARLAELRDEAAETALLANLVGRVPYLAAALSLAAAATAILAKVELASLLTWLVLVGAGIVAVVRCYVTANAAPFERAGLRIFARDLEAILLYVGFAWGAGSFLAISADASIAQMLVFSAGACALVGIIARRADATISFAIPATVLSAAAAAIGPYDNAVLITVAVLVAGFLVAVLAWLGEHWMTRSGPTQLLATTPAE